MSNLLQSQVNKIDWECVDSDTQYLTHSIHRYSGKFIPQIAKQAIQLLTNDGDLILDPYCGSGTTLLESALQNRKSIGIDLNPLATLISKVKTTPIKQRIINEHCTHIHDALVKYGRDPQLSLESNGLGIKELRKITKDPKWNDNWYKKWFRKDVLFELIAISQLINSISSVEYKNLALVAFSDILRKCSNAHSSYPNVMFDKNKKNTPLPIPLLNRRLLEISNDVKQLSKKNKINYIPKVILDNSTKMNMKSETIDAVITHPPYIASIPYAEYGMLSLNWLGYDHKDLDKRLTGGQRQSVRVVDRFTFEFEKTIGESFRVLKKKGKFFMLLGTPTVKGKKVNIIRTAIEAATKLGFNLIAKKERNGINRRANLMGKESLLVFEK